MISAMTFQAWILVATMSSTSPVSSTRLGGSLMKRHLQSPLPELFEDENGDGVPEIFQDEDGNGGIFGGVFGLNNPLGPCEEGNTAREDEDGNGVPDFIDAVFDGGGSGGESNGNDFNMPDWINIDWEDFVADNLDFTNITWNATQWGDFLQGLMGNQQNNNLEICPILESAVGIGQSFGMAGDCACEGQLDDSLSIECRFAEECVQGSPICGDVAVNFTFDDLSGKVSTSACIDASIDQYEEICFSYQVDMTASSLAVEQSCIATYGKNTCDCSIEDLCLSVDCSAYLPGAKMDTCQPLAFQQEQDVQSLIPRFKMFEESFTTIPFEEIDWTNLDWENLDWNNFDFTQVDWSNMDVPSITWGSLFSDDMTETGICPVLSRVLEMSDDSMGGCNCEGELESGFNILCKFEEQCTDGASLCGDVAIDFGFGNIGAINGSLCVDFAEDVHPVTCVKYTIPVADQESTPTCEAEYGDEVCKCSIDANSCAIIDCSMHERTAVMDSCQVLRFQEDNDVVNLVPRFAIPAIFEPVDELIVEEPPPEALDDPIVDNQFSEANTEDTSSGASALGAALLSFGLVLPSIVLSFY